MYRTWENFGGGKFWRIWQTVGNSPKFSPPIFINARVFNKLPTDLPNFSSPKTLEPLINLRKFSPSKIFPCTVIEFAHNYKASLPIMHNQHVHCNEIQKHQYHVYDLLQ